MDAFSFEPGGSEAGIESALRLLADKRRILVFTGAGVSTDSGIPDFRGPDGVWTRVDPAEFTFSRFMERSETRRRSWQMRAESGILDAEPNAAHRALVDLWKSRRMLAVVTQNIDGLHQKAGLPRRAVVELHGNALQAVCMSCRTKVPSRVVLERVAGGDLDPACTDCGGILKPDVVLFEETMPVLETDRAMHLAFDADAVVSIGSTLGVFPAAYVPIRAVETGAVLVIVNQGATELDDLADTRIEGPAGEVVPELVSGLVRRSRRK
ncbi:MAG: NAD-dependent deacylase [Actinobacteria bacterium]|nr:NAD-dependent deacylase [Actinomycetota bacterium]